MAQTDTSFAQFEKTYTALVDNRTPSTAFSVKKLSKKEWQNSNTDTAGNKNTLITAVTKGATTLTQIRVVEETYTTAPRGKGERVGQTIGTNLQFNGQYYGIKRLLEIRVTEWKPEEVKLVSYCELWLKVKLLYPNDNGERVIEKSTYDYIRLILPFDDNGEEKISNNTAYLNDTDGGKYAVTILPMDKKMWDVEAQASTLPQKDDSFAKAGTILSGVKVKEDKQYICALPLHPGQRSIPRFAYSIITEFFIKGLIKGKPTLLSYSGNEWAPQSVWLHTPQELWLKVKKIINSPVGNKKELSGKLYYIKMVLPFDGVEK